MNPFEIPCISCGDLIERTLQSDPATCTFCQRILEKRYDKRLEPKVRQPKIQARLTGSLHINKRISDTNFQLSWCCVPLDEHQLYSNFPDPLQMLMMKEEWEQEQKWKHVTSRVEYAAPRLTKEEAKIDKLMSTAPNRNRKGHLRKPAITKKSPERGTLQRHIKMSPVQFV
jgi:hypothetical protein